MKTNLSVMAGLMISVLFWYGYTYSLTADAFMIQGLIGALIPTVIGAWLFGVGLCVGRLSTES